MKGEGEREPRTQSPPLPLVGRGRGSGSVEEPPPYPRATPHPNPPPQGVWTGDIEDTVRGHRGHWSVVSDRGPSMPLRGAFGDGPAGGVRQVGVATWHEHAGALPALRHLARQWLQVARSIPRRRTGRACRSFASAALQPDAHGRRGGSGGFAHSGEQQQCLGRAQDCGDPEAQRGHGSAGAEHDHRDPASTRQASISAPASIPVRISGSSGHSPTNSGRWISRAILRWGGAVVIR